MGGIRKAARRGMKRGGVAAFGAAAARDTSRFFGKKPLNATPVKAKLGETSKLKGH